MRQSFEGETRDIITMEEYLKKRQAIEETQARRKGGRRQERLAAALKLAEILCV